MGSPVSSDIKSVWFEEFFASYLMCELELFSFNGECDVNEHGDFAPVQFCVADLEEKTFLLMREDCVVFVESGYDFLCEVCTGSYSAVNAGEDFSLARNNFENGFFEVSFGKTGVALFELAQKFLPSQYFYDRFSRKILS